MNGGATAPVTGVVVDPRLGSSARRRSRLRADIAILVVVGLLLIAALGAAAGALYRELYSPTAFVERYLGLLAHGRAADALAVPGVRVDQRELEAHGLSGHASDALLRRAVLTPLTDVAVLGEEAADGDTTEVTVAYTSGGQPGTTTFAVERNGWIGVAPAWRFAQSPLAMITLTVAGSQSLEVNGFALDKRQVSPQGADAAPLDPLPLLVFSPGLYRVSVDTALSTTPGVDVLADAPMTNVPLSLQAQATPAFVEAVQEQVNAFLDSCAQQQVLNPTGCPFGFTVRNRIVDLPEWTVAQYPDVQLVPAGADWAVPAAEAVAHIDVDIRLIESGEVVGLTQDVPFAIDADVVVLPDGSASIRVGAVDDGR